MKRLNYIGTRKRGVMISGNKWFNDVDANEAIDHLCENLPIQNWTLTGGLVMDLIKGRQVRPRRDIDIRVPLDHINEVIQKQNENSPYVFAIEYFQIPSFFFLDYTEFPKEVTKQEAMGNHLKFVSRKLLSGERRNLIDIVDVYATDNQGVEVTEGFRSSFAEDVFSYRTPNGNEVLATGPKYLLEVKRFLNRKKDAPDMLLLEKLIRSKVCLP
jgi:hypothetical protein